MPATSEFGLFLAASGFEDEATRRSITDVAEAEAVTLKSLTDIAKYCPDDAALLDKLKVCLPDMKPVHYELLTIALRCAVARWGDRRLVDNGCMQQDLCRHA